MVSAIRQRDHQAAVTNYLGTLNDVEARHAPGDSSPFLVRRGRRACGWQRRGNRLTQTGTMVLAYNALGQRIRKQGGSPGTVLFVYDDQGHLLGEYSSTGALVQETLWLGNIPVATLRPKSGGGIDLFYVHSDHLNTPRKVTRPSDNAIRWRWDPTPFGTGAPNQNPASLGTFVYHLRLPGQYFDTETALHYNYFRDYDPQIGRYVESDPTGIVDGPNTYSYVQGNPVGNVDRLGLETQPNSGRGKPGSYPKCIKWPGFPKSCGQECGLACSQQRAKMTEGCLKDCKWRIPIPQLLLAACSEAGNEWGRQCLDSCLASSGGCCNEKP
jgi:RHS repeat-associated protein